MLRFRQCCTALILATFAQFPSIARAQSTVQAVLSPPTVANAIVSPGNSTDSPGSGLSKFASGTGNLLFLGAGTLLPLLEDGAKGKEETLRTTDSLVTSTLITTALKHIVHEERPDSSARDSFPSGHATAAFAVATMESHYHPHQAVLWYGGASLIAYSRVNLNRHYWQDVLAGAAVGSLTAHLELIRPHGFVLAPFIHPRQEGGGGGLSLSKNF